MPVPIYQRIQGTWKPIVGGASTPRNNLLVGAASYHAPLSSKQSWQQILAPQVGPMTVRRSYEAEGTGVPTSWEASEASIDIGLRASVHSIRPPITSFISGAFDAKLRTFLRSIPADGYPKFLIGWHEGDSKVRRGEYTREQFLTAFKRFADIVHEENIPDVYTTVCYTGWLWLDPSQAAGNPELWWMSDAFDVFSVDYYGEDPASMFAPVLAYARNHNVPWAVSETGWAIEDQTLKAQRILDTADYCEANGSGGWPSAVFQCWFDSDVGFDPSLSALAFTPTSSPEAIAAANQACLEHYRDPLTVSLP